MLDFCETYYAKIWGGGIDILFFLIILNYLLYISNYITRYYFYYRLKVGAMFTTLAQIE